ncbi:MAG: M48 family metallopeptidase [Clostridia bacterium]|nr:M48 family metallopeptidase [Clostridia bacterium]
MQDYRIVRSSRKTVALELDPGGVLIVRAPYGCSDAQIRKIISENAEWIERAKVRQTERQSNKIELTEDDVARLKEMASDILPKLTERYAAVMGVHPAGVKITSAKTRFGSCSSKNSICFSYMLMLYPREAVEYVVVHELAHIRHHDHSAAFYEEVEAVLPDYRERSRLLRGKQKMP